MLKRVLIANRGEIALRILRACRELDIETVAVYSQADEEAIHVQLATQSVRIGPPRAADSYLNQDAILTVAKGTGCDGIHPGYGFLSENADFADACAAAGVFVIVRSCLLGSRCNLARYNRRSLGGMSEGQIEAMDDDLAERARRAKREGGTYAVVMCVATAVGLVLAFTPAAAFFLLAWPVGGIVCAAIKALRSSRSSR